MRFITGISIAFCIVPSVYAGGPPIEVQDLQIGSVTTSADEIVMKIEGTIDLSTLYPPREHRSDERTDRMGRVVHLFIENGTLRIPRKEWSHPAGSLYSEYTNWEQYQRKLKALENQSVFVQMWHTHLIIRDQFPKEIIAEHCKFSPPKTPNG